MVMVLDGTSYKTQKRGSLGKAPQNNLKLIDDLKLYTPLILRSLILKRTEQY